ncbi:LANO_0F16952g1_1 [Lachancea nothofagi CBS 11611]|uniref:LANO_0F16952g1_1 n=1 Tax=Lachancea nothofagi CBS 11611 TaxID=1266666 RepID=A0A1G4KCX4_9SACH|nr:LANO_0F16952g1_1 [Lachancea nothofagi CBS 11611]
MKVAILGAHGRVGQILCKLLKKSRGFEPLAIVRELDQKAYFEQELGVDADVIDIENSSVDQIGAVLKDCDAVVWTAGAGGKGIERIFTVDLDGSMKTIEACQKFQVDRFVMISAINAENREAWWPTALRNYYIAKRTADYVLRTSGLQYTILQPGSLSSESGTGQLCPLDAIKDKKANHYSIEREDVAQFIKLALENPELTLHKSIPLANGDLKMQDFLSQI